MKKAVSLLLCTVFCLGCIGCDSKQAKRINIVTSFYPIYIIAMNLIDGVDDVSVENMSKQHTGCLHDFQLQSDDMKSMEKASAFIINGAGMESFMDKVTGELPNLKIIDSSKDIELIDEDGEKNAHIWVSVTNYIKQVENIADGLAALDPSNSSKYKSNSVAYIKELELLRNRMHKSLDHVKHKDIITFHEAFPYFAKEFGLNIVSIINREPESEPSVKELTDTIEIIRNTGVKALFVEPQYPDTAAKTIANETGAEIYTLDPAVSGDGSKTSYTDIMEKNLSVLEQALK